MKIEVYSVVIVVSLMNICFQVLNEKYNRYALQNLDTCKLLLLHCYVFVRNVQRPCGKRNCSLCKSYLLSSLIYISVCQISITVWNT